jgi:hypothetical protein
MAGAPVGWVVVGEATVAGVLRYHGVLPSFLRTAVPEAGMVKVGLKLGAEVGA